MLFFVFSCSENKEKGQGEQKGLVPESEVDNIQSDEKNKLAEPSKVIDGIILAKFLPNNVPGSNKTPDKTGMVDEEDDTYTVASSEYVFPNNGFLKYSITDYGEYRFIPDYEIKLFAKPPIEAGRETEEFVIANSKGYLLWDNTMKEGALFVLVADRFICRIDATRLPKSSLKLQDYVKYFKIKELIQSVR